MTRATSHDGPRVSVVMTVFNPDAIYFPASVQSIVEQSFQDFEFIIVEDPSEQDGRDLLTPDMLSRLTYISNPHRTSLVSQKNAAIERVSGEFIAMIDADDVAAPDRLAKQVACLDNHLDVDVLGSQICLIDSSGKKIGSRSFPTEHEDLEVALRTSVPFCQSSVMLRTAALRQIGCYVENGYKTCEDYELWSRLYHSGVRFANHSEALLNYRIHNGQMKMSHIRDTIQAALYVKQRYWNDRMSMPGKLRMLGERMLLHLPDALLYELTKSVLYDSDSPMANEVFQEPDEERMG